MKITMKTAAYFVCALAAAFWLQTQAIADETGPKPGTHHVKPPGVWQEELINGLPGQNGNEISATDGTYYEFTDAKIIGVKSLPEGSEWDFLTIYWGGKLVLKNVPGAPWYNKKDPALEFVYNDVWVINMTRSWPTYGLTGQLDFQLTGFGDGIVIEGTYSGVPKLVSVSPYVVGDDLASAKIKVGKAKIKVK
jgi:hypothetical protein